MDEDYESQWSVILKTWFYNDFKNTNDEDTMETRDMEDSHINTYRTVARANIDPTTTKQQPTTGSNGRGR